MAKNAKPLASNALSKLRHIVLSLLLLVPLCAPAQTDTIWFYDGSFVVVDTDEEDAEEVIVDDDDDYYYEYDEDLYDKSETRYLASEFESKPFDEARLDDLIDDVNNAFDEEPEEEEEEPAEPREPEEDDDWDIDWPDWGISGESMRLILIIVVLTLLVTLLVLVISRTQFVNNRKVDAATYAIIEQMEEDLPNSDLERFLAAALADSNYKLAVRVYFLTIIQTLADQEHIVWKKDKTNNMYLRELRQHPSYDRIRTITRQYERIWYSNMRFGANDYERIKPRFDDLLQKLGAA